MLLCDILRSEMKKIIEKLNGQVNTTLL